MAKIELLHIDCMEYMAGLPDKAFDLAIVDPPYGIGMDGGKIGGAVCGKVTDFDKKQWDRAIPSPAYFDELRRVSRDQIIWGANYFPLPPTRGMVVWKKMDISNSFAPFELAWTSFDRPRMFEWLWAGMWQRDMGNKEVRVHPTQKPVALYRWLLQNYAKPGQRILDTHLGSGSIAIACDIEGFDLVGCEIDADYIAAARKRLADHQAQPRLFDAPVRTETQLALHDGGPQP